MAAVAGTSDPTRSHWPHGEGGAVLIQSTQVNLVQSKTNFVWDVFLAPFDFIPLYAQVSSDAVIQANGIKIDIIDEASSAQVLFNDLTLTVITAGGGDGDDVIESVIPDDLGPVPKGRGVKFRYTTASGDSTLGTVVRLWVRPQFS